MYSSSNMRFASVLLVLLAFARIPAAETPVVLSPAELKKVVVMERAFNAAGPGQQKGGSFRSGGLFTNDGDYEIATVTIEVQLFDPYGKAIVARKTITLNKAFEDWNTSHFGSLLPRTRAYGYGNVAFPSTFAARSYWIEVKGATGWQSHTDLMNVGHYFAEITRGHAANLERFTLAHKNLLTLRDGPIGQGAVALAAACNNVPLLKFYQQIGARLDQKTIDGDAPIHLATVSGECAAMQYLLSQHVDPNSVAISRRHERYTPLGYAARFSEREAAEILIRAGAKVDFTPTGALPPLEIAISNGDYAVFLVLLKHKANPNNHLAGQLPPIYLGVQRGIAFLKPLLDAGARPNESLTPHDHTTALHWAASHGSIDAVKLLLARGADVSLRDRFNRTALDYALERGDRAMAAVLRKPTKK